MFWKEACKRHPPLKRSALVKSFSPKLSSGFVFGVVAFVHGNSYVVEISPQVTSAAMKRQLKIPLRCHICPSRFSP